MGDKSPKSFDRKKKQDEAAKKQKQIAANAKAHPVPIAPLQHFGRKGK
ncbi:MAG: hypothetical protein HZB25_02515 [Candidatus Eisenbacteria bacterium]|nr:hypothetical protein [Candidatus Eisenbacteria bacterium]